jgi:glyoxylase-like metal-dependent hydrolase (beta-lactamase superfamily II)
MEEIVPHILHWTAFHPDIGQGVHSYCVTGLGPAILIDPMMPAGRLEWFRRYAKPEHIYLTNRLHYRESDRFVEAFGATVWCHSAGLHEFEPGQKVKGFEHGDKLPGGILALKVGALCPEETALLIPAGGGALSLGDAVIRENEHLEFVPDSLMGDDPKAVKRGLRSALAALLKRRFEHLLLAHGRPFVDGAKEALRQVAGRKAAAHHR